VLWRVTLRAGQRAFRAHGYNTRTAAIVGAGDTGVRFAQLLRETPSMGIRLVGFFDDTFLFGSRPTGEYSLRVEGTVDDVIGMARRGAVDIVYLALPMRDEDRMREIAGQLADTTVSLYVLPDFHTFNLMYARWVTLRGMPIISIYESPFDSINGWLKRFEDIVVASMVLCLMAIPMLVIATGIKLSSPGPVIFRQRRYGLKGDEVMIWKFRTMSVLEDGDVIPQARSEDPRMTRLGAFLRRMSLDELPQFINVLQGTMSVVGPRPHAVAHNERYRRVIHGYMLRHKVKPGITGLAQVSGWRGETDVQEKMEMRVAHDLEYISNWSLGLDLKIIAKTVWVAVSGKNAH